MTPSNEKQNNSPKLVIEYGYSFISNYIKLILNCFSANSQLKDSDKNNSKTPSESSVERDDIDDEAETIQPKIDFKEKLFRMSMKNDKESNTFKLIFEK